MDLRSLRAFVAVAEELHITRAAERLGMQQPPLTRTIHALEAEMGTPLLRRLPRGVRLTEAGRSLLEEARAVLRRTDALKQTVGRVARGESGRIAVGFSGSASLHPFVPRVLRMFHASHPGVSLVLEESGTADLAAALAEGRLDAAFIRSPMIDTPGLLLQPLLQEAMLVAMPTGHRLSRGRAASVPIRALAGERLVLHRRVAGPGLYDTILAACREAGFTPALVQEAPRLPTTLILVAAGMGLSIVPEGLQRVNIDGVAYRPLSGSPQLRAPLELAMRQDVALTPVGGRFRAEVRRLAEAWSSDTA